MPPNKIDCNRKHQFIGITKLQNYSKFSATNAVLFYRLVCSLLARGQGGYATEGGGEVCSGGREVWVSGAVWEGEGRVHRVNIVRSALGANHLVNAERTKCGK